MINKLGRYEILGVLGKGSMGVVYKGVDPQIGKLVAIKTMNPKIVRQEEMQERFYREGSLLGQLQHKNLITVYNVGTDGDICFIAMEYLDGKSLEQLLERKVPLDLVRILRILRQACEGVQAAHKMSVTHRDLKPANIFLMADDLVKILDFGVARLKDSSLTNSGMLLGTINYIAPEQITGLKVDHRADIFSIGVILYEMLTGKNPFLSRNISKTMVKIVNETPIMPKDIPDDLGKILMRTLEKDRQQRYSDLGLMVRDLDLVLRGLGRSAPATQTASPKKEDDSKGILNKMVFERIDSIKLHFRRNELEDVERLIGQLERLQKDHPSLDDLRLKLIRARRQGVEKKLFTEKFKTETLKKASQHALERHYVMGIETCDKVLAIDPDDKDAKVIRANCLRKMERFLEQVKKG